MTAEEIADRIPSGSICATGICLSEPRSITRAIGMLAKQGKRKHIIHHQNMSSYPSPFLEKGLVENYSLVSWFNTAYTRDAFYNDCADIMPNYFRDCPELYTEFIDVDAVCENNEPLGEAKPVVMDQISQKIGEYVAQEIDHGSTIQLGIGAIPEAVGNCLKEKRNLGIHTELFSDSMMELIMCGAANNAFKNIHTGKSVTTLAYGSKKLYNFLNDNVGIEFHPVNYVNDPKVIAMYDNFISVNGCVEVDFWGQVVSESIGNNYFSGSGGQVDYVRGARQSKGGKSFIVMPSTAKSGTVSRIKSTLTPGSVVTTSKNDVDYVVTEYGVAKLKGSTVKQRTQNLIRIAHPAFRDSLLYEAKQIHLL